MLLLIDILMFVLAPDVCNDAAFQEAGKNSAICETGPSLNMAGIVPKERASGR